MIPGPGDYDSIYKRISHKWYIRRSDLYKKVVSLVPKSSSSVVDIGCGSGFLATLMNDVSYTGFDFSHVAIEQAKSRQLKNCNFIECDIFKEDWGKYDCVVMMEVLEHLDRDIELINKVNTGSYIITTVPNNEIVNADGKPRGWPMHRRTYTIKTIEDRYGKLIKFNSHDILMHWIVSTGVKI